ncbi:non-homologous end-joining DNA ligase [Amycolatopsis minnesotensis]|uniref:Non-homologous end-joining DNA ligase n=1 Tax=Amycolatopsis minnesotensis TaxID=337894 RepID=A0ABP5BW42_9PSEU
MKAEDVEVSHTGKVFYPEDGLSKGDVIAHYRTVAAAMVPHLRGRPLTLRRYPDGIDGAGWFQKEAPEHFPDWVRVEEMPQRDGGSVHHVVCEDEAALVYLANQATIEFHIWTSTVDSPERPDLMVLDLDPPGGTGTAKLREIARGARDQFAEIGLEVYLQATGGRGFHLVVPLDATADHDLVRTLAREAADKLAERDPEHLTTAQRKDKRGDRVFLDTNRNGYAQTFVAPYSLRARPGAAAATPLDWAELGKAEPGGWPPAKLGKRLARKEDPWRDLHKGGASAEKALRKLRRG